MNILISTGIYPPKTSGPAQYAENMYKVWSRQGHHVRVKTFNIENSLPTGIRHLYYFFKILLSVLKSDFVFALDTFSVGFPTALACILFNKKLIIRTGGDFLWEGYVERTGDLVLLKDFYNTRIDNLSIKERIIFKITRWTLSRTDVLIFSTKWQRDIFLKPYRLQNKNIKIVENRYGEKDSDLVSTDIPSNRNFVASTRPLKWKNIDKLKSVFEDKDLKDKGVNLLTKEMPYRQFMDVMKDSYAVILMSLGDISPHMILDAIRLNKPFILTSENGLLDRIGSIAIVADPHNEDEIRKKIDYLLDIENYKRQVSLIKAFNFSHSWDEIAKEILEIYNGIKK